MLVSDKWQDYTVIDTGDSEKLERWNNVYLRRPDPSCLWPKSDPKLWNDYDAIYHRSNKGGGKWEYKHPIPETWVIKYQDLLFKVAPTGFKHTGIFPEQATNWDFINKLIKSANRDIKVLNLFAYTGGATIAASSAGASEVVHVDASKGMVNWAKENMELNHLNNHKIRFIVDDVNKFVLREYRRGHKYEGIILDPPSYGRGPNGEMWKLEDQLPKLILDLEKILADQPLFLIINTYTTGYTSTSLYNLLKLTLGNKLKDYKIETDQLTLPIKTSKLLLPCGITGRIYQ